MRRIYPEDGYSPAERERMRDAFRRRFVDGRHDAYAQFRSEVAELQAVSADEALQMYADVTRAPLPKAWRTLRARRTVGPVDPAPPLQTPLLSAWATLHLLLLTPAGLLRLRAGKAGSPWLRAAKKATECSPRIISSRSCADAPCSPAAGSCRTRACSSPIVPYASTCSPLGIASSPSTCSSAGTGAKPPPPRSLLTTTQPPHGRMCSVPGHHPHARSPAACVAGSTKSACSRSRRGGPRLARCACARSAESRRAPRTPLRFVATWRDVATAAFARARSVGSLSLTSLTSCGRAL